MAQTRRQLWLVYISLVLTGIIWGGSWVAAKIAVSAMDPYVAAALRNLLVCLTLFPLLWWREGKKARPRREDQPLLVFQGVIGIFIYSMIFFRGMVSTTAINGSLIITAGPVLIALLSGPLLREKLAWPQLLGFFLALAGVIIIVTRGSLSVVREVRFNSGDLILLAGTIGWALYSVAGKITTAKNSALVVTAYSGLYGTILSLLFALPRMDLGVLTQTDLRVWLALVFLAVLSAALGFLFWFEGIRIIGASRTAVFQYLVPLSTVVLAVFILGEKLRFFHVTGAILVLTGVYMATQAKQLSFRWKTHREANSLKH